MENELCFVINGKELYSECTLMKKENIPVVFICSDADRRYYVAVLLYQDEDTYLVAPISETKAITLTMGMIGLKEVFKDNIAYEVIVNKEDIRKSTVVESKRGELEL